LARVDLDLAGRQVRVDGALRARAHLAVEAHHPLGMQLLGCFERRRIRVHHHLGDAVVVAQVDEQHAAMVADAMAPAREANLPADVARAKRAAGVGAVTVHGGPSGVEKNRAESDAYRGGHGRAEGAWPPRFVKNPTLSTERRRFAQSVAWRDGPHMPEQMT